MIPKCAMENLWNDDDKTQITANCHIVCTYFIKVVRTAKSLPAQPSSCVRGVMKQLLDSLMPSFFSCIALKSVFVARHSMKIFRFAKAPLSSYKKQRKLAL